MHNDIADSFMWTAAVTDTDAVEHRRLVVQATVALSGTWPFLAAAKSEEEFNHRLALMEEQIEARTPEHIRSEVVAGLRQRWAAMNDQAQKTAAMHRTAALKIEAKDGELPQAYVHVHKHGSGEDEYHQVDLIGSSDFLQTIAKVGDEQEALTKAREYALPNGLPLYQNGRYVEGRRIRQGEEYFDAKLGRWVKAADDPTSVKQAPGRTNYQPDPAADYRYRYPIPEPTEAFGGQPSAPGSGSMNFPDQAQGSSIGVDGFPVDVAQGEYAGAAAAWQRQLTPGQWVVPPDAGWPAASMPNAATGQVQASRHQAVMTHEVQSFFPLIDSQGQSHPDQGQWVHHQVDSAEAADEHRRRALSNGAQDSRIREISPHEQDQSRARMMAARKQATEGVVPTPGANPNYFSQGTQGAQGPAQFPENPSSAIEPKVAPHIDEGYFEGQPPVQSSGTAEGLVDGGGYSRQASLVLHRGSPGSGFAYEAHLYSDDDQFLVGQWNEMRTAARDCDTFAARYASMHRVAVRKVADEKAPYRIVQRDGRWHVVNKDGESKEEKGYDSKAEARQHQKALYANVPGAAESAKEDEEKKGKRSSLERPPFGRSAEERTASRDRRWVPNRDMQEPTAEYEQAVNDGECTCDFAPSGRDHNCPVHHGVDPALGDMVDEAVPYESDIHRAYARRASSGVAREAALTNEQGWAKVNWTADEGDPQTHYLRGRWDARKGRPYAGEEHQDEQHARSYRAGWDSVHNASLHQASTDGRIVGLCDHCNLPVRYHTEHGGHLQHLHNSSPRCKDGRVATAMRHTENGVEYRLPLPKDSMVRLAAVLEAPTPENPTGRGADDFSARTFDALVRQRPMQSPEDRNANTPTVSREPLRKGPDKNVPNPGEERGGTRNEDEEDEDDD